MYSIESFAQSGSITISKNPTTLGTWAINNSIYTFTPNSSNSTSVVNIDDIINRLLGNGFTAGDVIIGSSSAANIIVNDDIIVGNTIASKNLTLSSGANITVNAQINTSTSSGNGGNISFTTTGGYIILNNTANLNASGTTSGGSISFTVTNGIEIASNITSTGSSSANNGAVSITIGSSSAFTPFDGKVTGIINAGTFTKSGAGTLMLSGQNIYTGLTTISSGVLNIQNSSALGTSTGSTSITSGAALEIQGGINIINESITLNGTGVSSTGALRSISGDNIWGGTISLGSSSEIAVDANSFSLNGIISGSNNLSKEGTGTLILGATNSYTGTTTIINGILKLTTGTNIPDVSGLIFSSSNATLDLNGVSETLYYLNSISGTPGIITNSNLSTTPFSLTINYTGGSTSTASTYVRIEDGAATLSFIKKGSGIQTLRGSSTYKGVTNVEAGTLYIRNSNALGTSDAGTVVFSGASLQINTVNIGDESLTLNGTGISNNGALNVTGTSTWSGDIMLNSNSLINCANNLIINGIISGSGNLNITGAGIAYLMSANTYTGSTTINSGGTVNIQNNNGLGDIAGSTTIASGADLQLQGNISINEVLSISSSGSNGAITNISGNNSILKTIILSAAFSILSDAGTLTLDASNSITGSFGLTIGGNGNIIVNGTITTGGNNITKNGTGTTTFNQANTYTGSTIISAGILSIFNNNALGTTAGGTTISSGASLQLNGLTIGAEALTLSGGTLINNLSASTWSGKISFGSSTSSTLNTNFDLTLNGIISGSGNITKLGSSTLFINSANTYTGLTTISAGTLKLLVATAIPITNSVVVNNATLDLNGFSTTFASLAGTSNLGLVTSTQSGSITLTISGSNSTSFAGIIDKGSSNNFKLIKSGSSTLTLSGANTYNGVTNVKTGTLIISNNAGLGSALSGTVVEDGATLQLNGAAIVDEELIIYGNGVSSVGSLSNITSASTWSGKVILASNASIGSVSSTLTIDGIISGDFTLTKVGAGVVELNGVNTFSGITTVSAGSLSIFNNAALGTANSISVISGAVLQLNRVDVSGKTLKLNGSGISNGGSLINATGTSTWSGNVILESASTVSTSAILTLSGVLSGDFAITKIGSSTLNLTNSNTYSGATTVSVGILNITAPISLGTSNQVTVSGTGQLQISGNNDFNIPLILSSTISTGSLRSMSGNNSWTGSVTLQANTGIGVENSSILKISGVMSGSFGVTKYGSGSLQFDAENLYTGTTTISAGTLKLLIAKAIPTTNAMVVNNATLDLNGISTTFASLAGTSNSGLITSSQSGTMTLTISGSNSTSYAGIIQNGSASILNLIKDGTSILTLSGANTYNGTTSINAGVINVQDNNALGSTIAGTIVANGAALQIEGSTNVGAEIIQISGSGISNTGAIRNMSSNNSIGGSITLVSDATIVSDASRLTLSAISGNYNLTIGGIGNLTIGGIINIGKGDFTKIGSGSVTLNAVNIYSGLTTISNGILQVGIIKAIPVENEVNIAIGASLDLAGRATTLKSINGLGKITNSSGVITDFTLAGTSTNTFDGIIEDGNGGGKIQLIKTGLNSLVLTGMNTYTGNTTVTSGVLKLGASNVLSNSSNLYLNGGEFNTNGFTESLGSLNILNNSIIRLDSSVVYSLTFASMGTITTGSSIIIYGWRGFDLDKAVTKNGFVGNASTVSILFAPLTKVFAKSTGGLQDIVNGGLTQYGQIVVAKPGNTGVKCTITINSILNNTALNSIKFYSITDNKTYASTQLASKILISQ